MMEFNEKLQELRKRKGLTQEELAQALYVSRTAVSKWESGRGMPNIESLKAIAAFFAVSLDALLSTDALLEIAEDERAQREAQMRSRIFGLLDCSMALLLFLPIFGQETDGAIQTTALLAATALRPYLRALYAAVIVAMAGSGVLTLALQSCRNALWQRNKYKLSFGLNAAAVLVLIAGRQPYAAAFAFVILIVKALMHQNRP